MPFNRTVLSPTSWGDGQVRLRRAWCGGGGKSRRDKTGEAVPSPSLARAEARGHRKHPFPGHFSPRTLLGNCLGITHSTLVFEAVFGFHVCTCWDACCAPISFHSLWSSPWPIHCRSAVPHCWMVACPLWEAGLLASQELVYSLARARRILSETRGCLMVSER